MGAAGLFMDNQILRSWLAVDRIALGLTGSTIAVCGACAGGLFRPRLERSR